MEELVGSEDVDGEGLELCADELLSSEDEESAVDVNADADADADPSTDEVVTKYSDVLPSTTTARFLPNCIVGE